MGAVVGGDEVKEMEADEFVGRLEQRPGGSGFGVEHVSPEFVDDLESEGDVTEHLSGEVVRLGEAGLGVAVFPELAAVVKKDAGEEQVSIEVGIDAVQGHGRAHHLGDVLDETSAPGVVIVPCGGGAAEALEIGGILGRIAPGARADLLLIAGDPLINVADTAQLVAVVHGGRFQSVARLLEQAEAASRRPKSQDSDTR